jgi:pimeloyl-ACP methyl ester carboxylesterase
MPILKLSDVDLHYDVAGSGTPMLLIAPTATHGEVWKLHQVPEFSRDHMVITYDLRGVGKSVVRSKDFSGQRQTLDAVELLNHLGAKGAVVWGHSMGGRIAQQMALDHPGLVGKLILASTGASFPTRGIPLGMCLELVELGYHRYLDQHARKVGFSQAFTKAHPDVVEAFLKVRLGDPPPLEIFLRHVMARQDMDTSKRLKDIRVPTLVTLGDDEDHPSASGVTHKSSTELLAREIPGAKLAIIPGGHYYPFVEPEKTNKIVRDFLKAKVNAR